MNNIVLLNKIKALMAENCEGTKPFEGFDGPIGLTLDEICNELEGESRENIELLLKLETQTFFYNNKSLRWKMFPKIVDAINNDAQIRKMLMKQVWDNTNISEFISYSDYYQILCFRKVDFEPVIDRCIKIGNCDPKILKLPSDEIWNTIAFSSDKEFEVRFNFMKRNAPSILGDSKIFNVTLSAYAQALNFTEIEEDEDYDDNEQDINFANNDGNVAYHTEYENHNYNYDTYNYGDGLDTSEWNLESILRHEGYTVSQKEDLSDTERQNILHSVLTRGLMTKWDIIEHIELQINLRKNNSLYKTAISKWERDLHYIRTYF